MLTKDITIKTANLREGADLPFVVCQWDETGTPVNISMRLVYKSTDQHTAIPVVETRVGSSHYQEEDRVGATAGCFVATLLGLPKEIPITVTTKIASLKAEPEVEEADDEEDEDDELTLSQYYCDELTEKALLTINRAADRKGIDEDDLVLGAGHIVFSDLNFTDELIQSSLDMDEETNGDDDEAIKDVMRELLKIPYEERVKAEYRNPTA